MKRILLAIVAIIFSMSVSTQSQDKTAHEVPCSNHGTQAEANACARLDYQKANVEMIKSYDQLMTELVDYGGKAPQMLQRAQASWTQYREMNCESEASIYEGGSIRPAVYYSCMASVTRERSRRLAEFLAVTRQ